MPSITDPLVYTSRPMAYVRAAVVGIVPTFVSWQDGEEGAVVEESEVCGWSIAAETVAHRIYHCIEGEIYNIIKQSYY